MIQVSNSLIVGRGQNGQGFCETRPSFWADMFRAVWGHHLHDEHGLEIIDIADFAPEQGRYAIYESVSAAERDIVNFFCGTNTAVRPKIIALFQSTYPNGLKEILSKHLEKDMAREQARVQKGRMAKKPHPSFTEAGISEGAALNLMNKGLATLAECANTPAIEMVDAGLSPPEVANIIDLAQRARNATIEAEKAASVEAVKANASAGAVKK